MLGLALERWHKLRRAVLAVLLLHMRCVALVGTGSRHHVRARAGRSSVSVGTSALLGHVLHLRLGMRRHRRVTLVLRGHEAAGRGVLAHHWRTSAHLRHVRPEPGAGVEARTHLVHFGTC